MTELDTALKNMLPIGTFVVWAVGNDAAPYWRYGVISAHLVADLRSPIGVAEGARFTPRPMAYYVISITDGFGVSVSIRMDNTSSNEYLSVLVVHPDANVKKSEPGRHNP